MNLAMPAAGSPWLDGNRRFAWVTPLAAALWIGLLGVFAHLLRQTAPPPPEVTAVEARLVEIPPPAGLQASPAPARAPVAPKPIVHHVVPLPHRVHTHPIAPPVPASTEGTAKSVASSAATPAAASAPAGGTGEGSAAAGGGLGTDSSGARAIYAPAPEIPDDMRDEPLEAVAIAHFAVSPDGDVQVTLIQPTQNSRLNALLLETLRNWRFAPATRNGVAVESQFDIRIPVTIE